MQQLAVSLAMLSVLAFQLSATRGTTRVEKIEALQVNVYDTTPG